MQRFTIGAVAAVLVAAVAAAAPAATVSATTAATTAAPAAPAAARAKVAAPPAQPLVDINRASRAELKKLPGIGDAEADRIVAHRPYQTKADLVLTKALPAGVYLQIKGRIIAKPVAAPKGKPRV
ncbi:ComEA family DNA-binding protein [Aquabacterium humicola]|uniref:ComEA family DNA-binding protein n=1 Tax=Aquabacterium humicola TaxID=3237377 RepID=UPI0025434315|nr:helix-hairpin-helix domain-containing protein [Rubrivivax pictus]